MVDNVGTTKFTLTAGGQLASEDGPWASDTVTNTYNNRFRSALSLQQPAGTWTNGFGFDEFARLTNVISPAGASSYQYRNITLPSGDHTACELVARLNLPNTSYITNNQDGLGRLLSTILKSSGDVTLNSHDYVYNNGSQRTHQTFNGGSYVDYYYDNISQLTNADSSVNGEGRGYAYDSAWNLSFRTNNGALVTFLVDGKNQLTNATPAGNETYDDNGNVTYADVSFRGYDYNDENRLVNWYYYGDGVNGNGNSATHDDLRTQFIYDGLGRLRKRIEYWGKNPPAWSVISETRYIYDGMRVIQERSSANTPTVSYTRGTDLSGSLEGAGGIGGLLARSHGYSGGIRGQTRLRIVDPTTAATEPKRR